MTLLLQRIFDALANGAVYASLAVALTMLFRASGVLNLAIGEMAMLTTYVAALLHHDPTAVGRPFAGSGLVAPLGTPWPVWASVLGAVGAGMILGAFVQRFIIQPLGDGNSLATIGAVIGLYLLFRGLATQWSSFPARVLGSPFPSGPDDRWLISGARLRYETVGTVAVLLGTLALLALFLQRSRYGLAFRALVSNPDGARLVGIRTGSVLMIGWAVASGLGALSGGLVASTLNVRPDMMARVLVLALAASILGGLGSPIGAVVGGFVFAVVETFLIGYVSFVTADVALVYTLGLLILALIVRPGGLFGTTIPLDRGNM